MYRYKHKTVKVNVQLTGGGMGDIVACLPALFYTYKYHPQVIQYIWCPDYAYDLYKLILPNDKYRLRIYRFSENEEKYDKSFYTRILCGHVHNSLGTHLVDHPFHVMVNRQVSIEEKNYPLANVSLIDVSKFNLPEKFVVITTGFTAKAREFLPEHINRISDYLLSKGYTPVYLGQRSTFNGYNDSIKGNFNEEIDFSKGLDLRDQTNLVEATKIISLSKAIVGLDNGLLHVAGLTNVPIVVGYSNVESWSRLPIRHNQLGWNCYPVELSKRELACSGCQTNWSYTYEHSFTECFYKDYQCLKMLNADKYIKELDKIL